MEEKFYGQKCQDEKLNEDFRNLHKEIVNRIAEFCKVHDLVIDDFKIGADGFEWSCKEGRWMGATDSYFSCWQYSKEYKDAFFRCRIKDKDQIERLVEEGKLPFMYSM